MDEKENLKGQLFTLEINASLNEHYYQRLYWLSALLDRIVRIAVGILAVVSIAYASDADLSWRIGLWSLAVAIILNVLPIQKWELDFRLLQTQWGEFRAEILEFEIELYGAPLDLDFLVRTKNQFKGTALTDLERKELTRLVNRRTILHTRDVFRWQKLIDKYFADEYERRFGKGVRDSKAAAKKVEELVAAHKKEQPAVA